MFVEVADERIAAVSWVKLQPTFLGLLKSEDGSSRLTGNGDYLPVVMA
jgi:hypothetical protein